MDTPPKLEEQQIRARQFVEELAALLERHNAGLGYTTNDDGIHLELDDFPHQYDLVLGFLARDCGGIRELRELAQKLPAGVTLPAEPLVELQSGQTLDPAIYNDPSPTWKERAETSAMTENSWDTDADAELSDKIEEETASPQEIAYMVKKYGNQWDIAQGAANTQPPAAPLPKPRSGKLKTPDKAR